MPGQGKYNVSRDENNDRKIYAHWIHKQCNATKFEVDHPLVVIGLVSIYVFLGGETTLDACFDECHVGHGELAGQSPQMTSVFGADPLGGRVVAVDESGCLLLISL